MSGPLQRFAWRPEDSPNTRLEKSTIFLVAGCCTMAGAVWSLMYLLVFGPGLVAALPMAFVLVVGGALWVSHRIRDHRPAVYAQIVCIMYITAFIQWRIGDLFASGFVMAWAFCGPIVALAFFRARQAAIWFALYFVNIAVTVYFNDVFAAHGLTVAPSIRALFFVMNLAVSSFVIFLFAAYFVAERRRAEARLEEQHALLVSSQQALVHSEKMASLGQLVAGIAHELNTPLGAIRASVGNLANALDEVIGTLLDRLAAVPPDRRAEWIALVRRASAPAAPRTSREERAARRKVAARLEEAGIGDRDELAALLVEIGLGAEGDDDQLTPLLALLRGEQHEELQGAYNVTAIVRNSQNIRIAADRAAKIVFALKSYAHPGDADGESVRASLADNLDTVLTLYHSQLKHDIELVRDYQDRGLIDARHDELNQVWTNLVHNALQAMSYKGRLEVSVGLDGDAALVAVTDSGRGIPPAQLGRVFEPFFTTKAAGEGSGLGLSICRDIVAKHGGGIEVESQPGRTRFTVRLPRLQAKAK